MAPMLGSSPRWRAHPRGTAPAALPLDRTGQAPGGEELDAAYWAAHVWAPVRYEDAAASLLEDAPTHSSRSARSPCSPLSPGGWAPDPPEPARPSYFPSRAASPAAAIGEPLAGLHRDGLDPDWDALYAAEDRVRQRLAPYVFSTEQRYWSANPVTPVATHRVRPERAGGGVRRRGTGPKAEPAVSGDRVTDACSRPSARSAATNPPNSPRTCACTRTSASTR